MKRSLSLIRKSFEYFRPFKWPMLFVIVLALTQNALSQVSSVFLGKVVDAATVSNVSHIVLFLVLYLLCAGLLPQLLARFRFIFDLRTSEYELFNYIQKTSFIKSLRLSLGQLRSEHSGFRQDVLRSGEGGIDYFHYLFTEQILPTVSSFAVSVIGLYFIDVRLSVVALTFAVLYLIYGSYLNRTLREPLREQSRKKSERSKVYVDLLQSLFFIKFANQKEKATSHLVRAQQEYRDHAVWTWTDFHRKNILSDLLMIGYYSVFTYLVYRGLSAGEMTAGTVIPVFTWMMALSGSLEGIREIMRRSNEELTDIEKMFEMLEQKSDVDIDPSARPIAQLEKGIAFEQVGFDYRGGKQGALKDVNFEIGKGEKVALVGRSGSGKTTLVSLLLRLYDPTEGAILADGVQLRSLVLEDWHNLIAYVPQDGDLLDISIRENILFGARHQVTEPEIEAVLDKAGIREFVHGLPQGLDTVVGERGIRLSGGQKQRVCIARALIKDAPILLLDEATSSLDSETESIVNKAIWDMLGGKTGVVIAHRLSTIIDADKIVVMDHGKIVGIGTHQELLRTTPYYKKLVDAQNVNL